MHHIVVFTRSTKHASLDDRFPGAKSHREREAAWFGRRPCQCHHARRRCILFHLPLMIVHIEEYEGKLCSVGDLVSAITLVFCLPVVDNCADKILPIFGWHGHRSIQLAFAHLHRTPSFPSSPRSQGSIKIASLDRSEDQRTFKHFLRTTGCGLRCPFRMSTSRTLLFQATTPSLRSD